MIAHGGQFAWDEALLVFAPLVVIAALLWLAQRRVRAKRAQAQQASAGNEPAPQDASQNETRQN